MQFDDRIVHRSRQPFTIETNRRAETADDDLFLSLTADDNVPGKELEIIWLAGVTECVRTAACRRRIGGRGNEECASAASALMFGAAALPMIWLNEWFSMITITT